MAPLDFHSTHNLIMTRQPLAGMVGEGPKVFRTGAISSGIGAAIPILALLYGSFIFWTVRIRYATPRPLNKSSGVVLQKILPVVYIFVVLAASIEVALNTWLLLQYHYNGNYPSPSARKCIALLLFSSSWTMITGGISSILFIHPSWSTLTLASIGVQAVWLFTTWLFWIVGTAILNTTLPQLMTRTGCSQIVYCEQLRGAFVVSSLEVVIFLAAFVAIIWVAWQSTTTAMRPMSTIDDSRKN